MVAEGFKQRATAQNPPRAAVVAQDPEAIKKHLKTKKEMANHKSAEKRIRQTKTRTLHNKYYAKTMRNAVRKLRAMTDKEEALKVYPTVQKMLDKLVVKHIIHKNKAANLKSGLVKHINGLS